MDDPCQSCHFRDENEQGNVHFGFGIKHQEFLSFADTNAGRAALLMMYDDYETPGMRLVNGYFYLELILPPPGSDEEPTWLANCRQAVEVCLAGNKDANLSSGKLINSKSREENLFGGKQPI